MTKSKWWTVILFLSLAHYTNAQFNSGSTGADGALDLATMNCQSSAYCDIQLPESGVLNYTTVNIPGLKILRFKRNSRNTPAVILAQGDVSIIGRISASALRVDDNSFGFNIPGPGGFYGGDANRPGLGPGGGQLDPGDPTARWVGPLTLFPIIGGSGGAGQGGTGCGGAGALIVASSGTIRITNTGQIFANAYFGPTFCSPNGGSGGAIRLMANNMEIAGQLLAIGSSGTNNGTIRMEANSLIYTGTSTPLPTSAPINPNIVPGAAPQLTISSIGPSAVPSYAGTRFDLIDLLLPNSLTDPIPVVVSAQNIPTGTQVQIGFVNGSANGTSTPCNLAGSLASSSCTGTISNLNRTGGTYLLATAAFAPPVSIAQFNPKGANQVAKIKLESAMSSKPKYTFLRLNGTVIDPKVLPSKFLIEFGM